MNRTVPIVAVLLVLTPVASVAGVGGIAPAVVASTDTTSSGDDVIETANDNIGIWERAPFPLRANTSAGATVVQNQQLLVDHWEDDRTALARYDQLAVYDNETAIPLEFTDSDAGPIGPFVGNNSTVIVGKFDGNATAEDVLSTAPSSVADLRDTFSDENLSELNANVTFTELGTESIDSDGFSTDFTPDTDGPFGDGVGQYVVMAAVSENTTDAPDLVTDGDLSPQTATVFVGAEALVVQETSSTVTVDGVEPGDDVTFDVDVNVSTDGDVDHAVALYHEDTFNQNATTINLTAPVDENFSAEDVIVESDIGEINGVSDLDGEMPIFGGAVTNASQSGTVNVVDVFSFLEGEFDQTTPQFEGGNATLDASVVSVANANASETITVETFGNWTEGEYQWIHLAGTEDGSFTTSSGTLSIQADDSGGGGSGGGGGGGIGGGGGGGALPPSDPGEPDFSVVESSLSSDSVDTGESFEITATVENGGDADGKEPVELRRNGVVVNQTTLSIAAGDTKTITFTQTIDEAGRYEYSVGNATAGTVLVAAPTEASFETSDVEVSDTDVTVGETVEVTATVANLGGTSGTHTASLNVNGSTVDTTDVTLNGGESETVTFSHTFDEGGTYEVSVDDATAGTVTVEGDGGDGGDSIPGFGVAAALLAIVTTLAVARTRAN